MDHQLRPSHLRSASRCFSLLIVSVTHLLRVRRSGLRIQLLSTRLFLPIFPSFPPPRSASVSVKLRRKHFSIRREEKRLNSNEYIDRLRRSSGSGRSSGGHPRSSFLLYNRRRNNILHNRRGEERDTMIPWRERSPLSIDGPESCRF